jgi:hypothetical protein
LRERERERERERQKQGERKALEKEGNNPSYSGGRDKRILSSRSVGQS